MDVASVVVAGGSVIVAVIALVVAVKANTIAKKGNGLANSANETAAEALGEAQEANTLAGDANTIAERALRVAQDDVPFHWVLRVEDSGAARVLNDCGHRAFEVTVVIDRAGTVIAEAGPVDMDPFGVMLFDLDDAIAQHFEVVRQHPARPFQSGEGWMSAGSAGKAVATVFRAHLRWLTEQQVPRTDVIEEVVRHRMTTGSAVSKRLSAPEPPKGKRRAVD